MSNETTSFFKGNVNVALLMCRGTDCYQILISISCVRKCIKCLLRIIDSHCRVWVEKLLSNVQHIDIALELCRTDTPTYHRTTSKCTATLHECTVLHIHHLTYKDTNKTTVHSHQWYATTSSRLHTRQTSSWAMCSSWMWMQNVIIVIVNRNGDRQQQQQMEHHYHHYQWSWSESPSDHRTMSPQCRDAQRHHNVARSYHTNTGTLHRPFTSVPQTEQTPQTNKRDQTSPCVQQASKECLPHPRRVTSNSDGKSLSPGKGKCIALMKMCKDVGRSHACVIPIFTGLDCHRTTNTNTVTANVNIDVSVVAGAIESFKCFSRHVVSLPLLPLAS